MHAKNVKMYLYPCIKACLHIKTFDVSYRHPELPSADQFCDEGHSIFCQFHWWEWESCPFRIGILQVWLIVINKIYFNNKNSVVHDQFLYLNLFTTTAFFSVTWLILGIISTLIQREMSISTTQSPHHTLEGLSIPSD